MVHAAGLDVFLGLPTKLIPFSPDKCCADLELLRIVFYCRLRIHLLLLRKEPCDVEV